jgi:hypothetical protein
MRFYGCQVFNTYCDVRDKRHEQVAMDFRLTEHLLAHKIFIKAHK